MYEAYENYDEENNAAIEQAQNPNVYVNNANQLEEDPSGHVKTKKPKVNNLNESLMKII